MKPVVVLLALASSIAGGQALAQSPTASDWSGAFLGVHGGYGLGTMRAANMTPASIFFGNYWTRRNGQAFDLPGHGGIAGAQAGYQFAYKGFVLGAEASGSFAKIRTTRISPFFPTFDKQSSRFGNRFGFAVKAGVPVGRFLPYLKIGYVNSEFKFRAVDALSAATASLTMKSRANGVLFGAGVDYAISRQMTLGIEYGASTFATVRRYGHTKYVPNFSERYGFSNALHSFTLRANYLFGGL